MLVDISTQAPRVVAQTVSLRVRLDSLDLGLNGPNACCPICQRTGNAATAASRLKLDGASRCFRGQAGVIPSGNVGSGISDTSIAAVEERR
jgi:hypothetical protein